MDPAGRESFLPLAEAARRLGVSRLKLREAAVKGVVPSRRDNEGRLRVDLSAAPPDVTRAAEAVHAAPAALIEALFDEIEELQADLADRTETVARFADLAGRQQEALERAAEALETSQRETARLAGLLDRALDLAQMLEGRGGADPAAERALELLEETAAALEASRAESARLAALTARAVAHADAAAAAAETRGAGLAAAADRALALADRATRELESARADSARAAALLARATDTAERLEAEVTRLRRDNDDKAGVIASQEGMVNQLFSLSETALEAAAKARRTGGGGGLLSRLFGGR